MNNKDKELPKKTRKLVEEINCLIKKRQEKQQKDSQGDMK